MHRRGSIPGNVEVIKSGPSANTMMASGQPICLQTTVYAPLSRYALREDLSTPKEKGDMASN